MELQIVDLDQFAQIIASVASDATQPLYFRLKPRTLDVFCTNSSKQLFSRANLYLADTHMEPSEAQPPQSQTQTQTPFQTQNGPGTQARPQNGSVFVEKSCTRPQTLFAVNAGVFLTTLGQL